MDVFAHVLWTNVVFYKKFATEKAKRYIAVAFGVVPDLVGFTPAFFYMLFSGRGRGPEAFNSDVWVFKFASEMYNYSHSLVLFTFVMLVVLAIRRGRQYWPMWGWALHILIDVPSHRGFYETPFLFPLSSYRFSHGVSWSHPVYMIINYATLAAVYLFWFLVLRKKCSGDGSK